jgi:aspartate aminotransferase-like enzyme
LDRIEAPNHYSELAARSERVRSAIAEMGLVAVTPAEHASPAVFTIALPAHLDAGAMGDALAANGIFVNYETAYLRDRNWFQVCLMGDISDADIERLLDQLSAQ